VQPTQIRAYQGASEAQAQQAFAADMGQWHLAGWQPSQRYWDGSQLVVTYVPLGIVQAAPLAQVAPLVPPVQGWRAWSGRKKAAVFGGSALLILIVLGAAAGPRPTVPAAATATAPAVAIATPTLGPATPTPGVAVTATSGRPTSQAATAAPAGLGTLAEFKSNFRPFGFTGEDSPLSDGRPRWLARRASDSAVAEAIGPADQLAEVSLSLGVTSSNASDAGTLFGAFLNTYAPGSRPFFRRS
jgi:hypothetical protein